MRIAIGGASGLVGSALAQALRGRGDEVVALVRSEPTGPDQRRWWPEDRRIATPGLTDVDAVVVLNGAGLAEARLTEERKRLLLESRLDPVGTAVEALATAPRCRALLSGSAVGYYGSRGEEVLDEASAAGEGFLADLVTRWEAAAETTDARTVLLRTGIVLSPDGGMVGRLMLPFRIGLGGRIGDGRQYLAWISLRDEVGAILHLLDSELAGPFNLTAPAPVTNAEFTDSLGAALHRPTVLPTPLPALRLALGSQLVDEALLASQRVVPERLLATGYGFADPTLDRALKLMLG